LPNHAALVTAADTKITYACEEGLHKWVSVALASNNNKKKKTQLRKPSSVWYAHYSCERPFDVVFIINSPQCCRLAKYADGPTKHICTNRLYISSSVFCTLLDGWQHPWHPCVSAITPKARTVIVM